jgi:hypothetical protein
LVVALLALPLLRADDKPKDDKKEQSEKKEQTPKEQYLALVREFNEARAKLVPQVNKAKDEERQKLIEKYYGMGKEFAERVYKIAEENPKDPVAVDAIFWVLQNGGGSEYQGKAADKLTGLIGEIPLAELSRRLTTFRAGQPKLLQAVYDRAIKDEKESLSVNLLAWVATTGPTMGPGEKAISRLFEKHPDHAAVARICSMLARTGPGTDRLKKILDGDAKPTLKASAALALGETLASKSDDLSEKPEESDKVAAEAEKYLTAVVDQYAKDDAAKKKQAEKLLKALRTLRVGKEAPDIKGVDLDEKEFKLSDYRGKVVLLDFWGNW